VRASKLLARPIQTAPDVADYEPYDKTSEAVATRLASVPVAYVILHNTTASHSYRHHDLLRAALEQSPQEWALVYSSQRVVLDAPHTVQVYHSRKDVRGIPVHIQIDLTEKLGAPVTAGPDRP
jgi:hypothetical protein